MYRISFYVPPSAAESVKNAMFETGAGKIGNYDCCCWESVGKGQFRPLEGSNPHIGEIGIVEKVTELKVEMVCDDRVLDSALNALVAAHPYEEPAYNTWPVDSDRVVKPHRRQQ